jgi:cyclohexanecarboxylate-CoA ligase
VRDQVTTWWRLVARRAAASPDAVMLRDDLGRSLTFAKYAERAERVAAALRDQGVGAGTVVSWQLPTCAEALVLMGALARLGAVQNPILPILRDAEVRVIVGQVCPDLVIVPARWRGLDHSAAVLRERRRPDAAGDQPPGHRAARRRRRAVRLGPHRVPDGHFRVPRRSGGGDA